MAKNMGSKNEYVAIRPPIVTVMGHVDHGKTSILDYIRKTDVQAQEYGGITQHIGAYQVVHKSQKITFIDTPGHEAFVQMRARGGKAADIVILVVSAVDGVQPQTKEAVAHAKSAGSPIIVAINKIDLPGANIQKTKQELASENVLVEDWGGEIVCIPVSAKTGENIDKLLDAILALAEVLQLKGSPNDELEAVIVESKLDRQRGVSVSCIVRNGTLRVGDKLTAGGLPAKVRSLVNDKGETVKEAGPSTPVEILGFSCVPHVGDLILLQGSELIELAEDVEHMEIIGKDAKKTIGIILKSDTSGTLEAVKASLADLVTSSIQATYAIKFVHTGTGDISESDVILADGAKGIVLGFGVKISANVKDLADAQHVVIKTFRTIYDLIDYAKQILEGTAIQEESKIKGRAQVIKLFKLESGDIIVGCKVIAGTLKVNLKVQIYDKDPADVTKEDVPLFTGHIKKLKIGKNEVNIVGKDNDCGVLLKPQFEDIKEGMWLEMP